MYDKKKPRMIFQDRDLQMLKFIGEMKFAGIRALKLLFFSNSSCASRCRIRISLLSRWNCISSVASAHSKEKYYYLKRQGRRLLDEHGLLYEEFRETKTFCLNVLKHTTLISDIRSQMESQGKIKFWVSEKELRESYMSQLASEEVYIPDGFFMDSQGKSFIFELELTQKSKKRIENRIDNMIETMSLFSKKYDSCKALIICKTQSTMNHYKRSPYSRDFEIKLLDEVL